MSRDLLLTKNEQRKLLALARESIARELKIDLPFSDDTDTDSLPAIPAGAFVTLKEDTGLRGCIGRILSDEPLWKTVMAMAKASAFEDRRFPPLAAAEFPDIMIEISVLSRPEPVGSVNEIRIGTDGIIVTYGMHRALFLPQVPVEQKWDLEQYLGNCCRKAGLEMDIWKKKNVEIEAFTAFVFSEE